METESGMKVLHQRALFTSGFRRFRRPKRLLSKNYESPDLLSSCGAGEEGVL
jgi:hypothetical protein